MKTLAKIMSGLLLFVLVLFLIETFIDIDNHDFYMFVGRCISVFTANIIPIISMCLCFYCLERNDSNYFLRLIPIYMMVSIVISIMLYFLCYEDYARYIFNSSSLKGLELNGISSILIQIQEFISPTHLCVALISLLCVIRPNNEITSMIKKVTYGIIIVNVAMSVWINIKSYMQETLPNVYEYEGYDGKGFNFSSVSDSRELAGKIYNASAYAEIFAVLLLFTTNYGFSVLIEYEDDEIDMYEVKKEADQIAQEKMKSLYDEKARQLANNTPGAAPLPAAPVENQKGLMNINNQLGADSNVGQVKESAKEVKVETSTMDELVALSSGPVINETVNREPLPNMVNPANEFGNQNVQEQAHPEQVQTTEAVQEQTTESVSVQEVMQKESSEAFQEQVVVQESVPQQPTETVQVQPQEVVQQDIQVANTPVENQTQQTN